MRVLHLGCGRKKLSAPELFAYVGLTGMDPADVEVIHLDADPRLHPDLVCELGVDPIQLDDDSVDLVIAWHVLEHIGTQGQSAAWFAFWEDLYRVLKPNGWLYAECPYYSGIWAWSDPTHTRAISEHSFLFFNQDCYRIPGSMISPYRVTCDFQFMGIGGMERGFRVITAGQDERPEPAPKRTPMQMLRQLLARVVSWWKQRPTSVMTGADARQQSLRFALTARKPLRPWWED